MQNDKTLPDDWLKKVRGGSNDYLWTQVGRHAGNFMNCMDNPVSTDPFVSAGYCIGPK